VLAYWSLPACGLALPLLLRLTRLDGIVGLAAALLVLPFSAPAAIGCAAGALIALRWIPRGADGDGRLQIGTDRDRRAVTIPLGRSSGSHSLIVGATGSGKTVTQALIVGCAVSEP
jgi:hypothetical protein